MTSGVSSMAQGKVTLGGVQMAGLKNQKPGNIETAVALIGEAAPQPRPSVESASAAE